jgi:hypothetical protein
MLKKVIITKKHTQIKSEDHPSTPNVQSLTYNLTKKTKQATIQNTPARPKAAVINRLVPPNMFAVVITKVLSAFIVLALRLFAIFT